MPRFEELQELWQAQPEIAPVRDAEIERLLRGYRRRQAWIYGAKALVAGSVAAAAVVATRTSIARLSGVLLVAAAAALLLARDWRNQRALARRDFAAPSLGFIEDTIGRLLAHRDIGRACYWPFLAALIAGENLVLEGTHSFWLRVAASVMPAGALEAGLWVRRRRFDHESRPLLEQLRAAKAALEGRFE